MIARTRATNSSGENGTVRMSSTPRSKAANFVPAPRQCDDGEAPARLRRICKTFQDTTTHGVHVEDDEMGVPVSERDCGCFSRSGHADAVLAVMECELHDVGEYELFDYQ
jgi:hypothetical protein